jgi:N-methylhydantoinase B
MTIDLTESDDARLGPVNCGEAQAISACRVAYKLLINADNPPNGGAFRPLEVKVRRGSLLGAEEPFPCQWYFTPLGLLIDLVVKALAEVLPEQAAGASYGDSMIIGLAGLDPRNANRPWFDLEPTVGGWGAWQGSDGEDGLINNVNGSLKDLPIEVFETKYPMRLTHYGFRASSGGAGRWRGGNGIEREYTLDADAHLFLWFERSKTPAWGLFGGRDATPPIVVVNPGREDERRLLKASRLPLRAGDVVRTMSGGGGGFGDPRERDPEDVRRDLRNRHVDPQTAREVYGVEDA